MEDQDLPSNDPAWREHFGIEARPVWLVGETVVAEPVHEYTAEEIAQAAEHRKRFTFSTGSVVLLGGEPATMEVFTDPEVPGGTAYVLHSAMMWPAPVDEGMEEPI